MPYHITSYLVDQNPAMNWIKGAKREQVIQGIIGCCDYGLVSAGFLYAIAEQPELKIAHSDLLLDFCNMIAETAPLNVDQDKIVFFSGSSQKRAEDFVNENPAYNVIHTTTPGALMELYGLFDKDMPYTREQRYEPWNILSRRLAQEVQQDATAILDIPKPTSTFVTQEMPAFLQSKDIITINKIDKHYFWENLKLLDVPAHELAAVKAGILVGSKI